MGARRRSQRRQASSRAEAESFGRRVACAARAARRSTGTAPLQVGLIRGDGRAQGWWTTQHARAPCGGRDDGRIAPVRRRTTPSSENGAAPRHLQAMIRAAFAPANSRRAASRGHLAIQGSRIGLGASAVARSRLCAGRCHSAVPVGLSQLTADVVMRHVPVRARLPAAKRLDWIHYVRRRLYRNRI